MSALRVFGIYVVVTMVAATLFGVALVSFTVDADAAPYPPSEPCSVSATARQAAAEDGTTAYDVVGSGLGAVQPVRVLLAATGQQVGSAETDTSGNFRTVVTAPQDRDSTAPDLTALSPQQTCTSTPPPGEPSGAPSGASNPTRSTASSPRPSSPGAGNPPAGPAGPGGASSGQDGSGNGGGTSPGSGTAATTPGGTSAGGGTTAPSSGSTSTTGGSDATGGSTSSTPPLAEPLPGTETPFGIGLGIAAVLLVLGTLAVLLLTRRPER